MSLIGKMLRYGFPSTFLYSTEACTVEKALGHGPENLDSGISSDPDKALPSCSSSSDLSFVNCKMKGWPTDLSSSLQCK